MKTLAPELRALIIIFGSTGPVISTRRSSRSAGAVATRQPVSSRTCAVSGRKPGSTPASKASWRLRRAARSASRWALKVRCRLARNASASEVSTSAPWADECVTSTPTGRAAVPAALVAQQPMQDAAGDSRR